VPVLSPGFRDFLSLAHSCVTWVGQTRQLETRKWLATVGFDRFVPESRWLFCGEVSELPMPTRIARPRLRSCISCVCASESVSVRMNTAVCHTAQHKGSRQGAADGCEWHCSTCRRHAGNCGSGKPARACLRGRLVLQLLRAPGEGPVAVCECACTRAYLRPTGNMSRCCLFGAIDCC
jgi:hypothetical protein